LAESTGEEIAAVTRAHSGWEPWESLPCPPYVLQWFRRPGPQEFQLPAVEIDVITLWVPVEQYPSHLTEYSDAGWLLFDDPNYDEEDGSRIVIWESPRLHALRSPALVDPPPPSPAAHSLPVYLSPSPASLHSRDDWQSTIQSGMRTGAFAAFLDGILGDDFFDF
jgi:hypothetical protein